ncbi:ribonucleoside-diphosphate reductase 1 subunit alpha [Klebsiella phage KP13-16]|nr:ribonucleoside-diphosphate reductase 1 subunit alpha [Klebsiella phage KP13-16]
MINSVVKSNGSTELFSAEKINQVIEWACEDLDVCASDIAMNAKLSIYDGISTKNIHETIIKSAADLISVEQPDYQYVAARLLMFKLRKEAYGTFTPPSLFDHVTEMINLGKYDQEIILDFTEEEFNYLDSKINHEQDFEYAYAASRAFQDKYLVQDKITGTVFETPQMAFMLVGMCLHSKETCSKEERLKHIVDFYQATSQNLISLPTPIIAGVRTPTRQFSSCVLIEAGDTIDQIFNANTAQGFYSAQRAGIGLNVGMIRGDGAPVRGGSTVHSGLVPIIRMFQESLGWVSQGGLRKGSANYFYPMWHWDYESLVVLKNNRGTEETRARHVDYTVQVNRLMYKRLQENGNISFFHPNVANGELYKLFFEDQDKFEQLYVQLENDPNVKKKTMPAFEAWKNLLLERSQTGRIYIMNVDTVNDTGPFNKYKAPIKQSNLCVEITLPTSPMNNIYEGDGLVSTCTLAAFNLGEVDKYEEILRLAKIIVRALDNLLDYQNYPVKAAEKGKDWRNLGVGVINYAYFLAKKGLRYSDRKAKTVTHELFEKIQYALLTASLELAKERGAAKEFDKTTYFDGVMPVDRYVKKVDNLHDAELQLDWDALREEIKVHGLRNCTLSALMPSESSSQVSNATNGIEPPRSALSFKSSKSGTVKQLVPEVSKLKDVYEYKWDMHSCRSYLELAAIMQKFVDQSISTNTPYKPHTFKDSKLPLAVIIKDIVFAKAHGIKTLYYHETEDGNIQEEKQEVSKPSEETKPQEPEHCDSCAI